MKVLIAGGGTGGHLIPALAIADALGRRGVEVVLVGSERGIEKRILPARAHRYHLLPFHPIYRRQWWRNLAWPWRAVRLYRRTARLVRDERPDVVLGTGGYVAGPVLVAAIRQGIPVALQEQNAFPGITTRLLARRARRVFLGFAEARDRLRAAADAVIVTGNPAESPPSPRPERAMLRARLSVPPERPVVLVMGGSQGARAINSAVAAALRGGLLEGITVLWSTGHAHHEHYRVLAGEDCVIRPYWDPISEAYGAADLVVGRAGAMSTAEVCLWGLPSILIPLPGAAADHQTANARALERVGAAMVLPEAEVTAASLAQAIRSLVEDPDRLAGMGRRARENAAVGVADTIAGELVALVG